MKYIFYIGYNIKNIVVDIQVIEGAHTLRRRPFTV